jgi:hypothetical protein
MNVVFRSHKGSCRSTDRNSAIEKTAIGVTSYQPKGDLYVVNK